MENNRNEFDSLETTVAKCDGITYGNRRVTKCGRVFRRMGNGEWREQQPTARNGYLVVSLGDRPKFIHRIVAFSWGLPKPSPDHSAVHHINADGFDNSLENLEWVTPRENTIAMYANASRGLRNERVRNGEAPLANPLARTETMRHPVVNGVEYRDYLIDEDGTFGQILENGRIVRRAHSPARKKGDYKCVYLRRKSVFLHRAVLETFRGKPPPGKPLAHHRDRNPANNHLDNLEWASYRTNGRESANFRYSDEKILEAFRLLDDGLLHREASEKLGINLKYVTNLVMGTARPDMKERYLRENPDTKIFMGAIHRRRRKLTEEQVWGIFLDRERSVPFRKISRKYGVGRADNLFSQIAKGKTWKRIKAKYLEENPETRIFEKKCKRLPDSEIMEVYRMRESGMDCGEIADRASITKEHCQRLIAGKYRRGLSEIYLKENPGTRIFDQGFAGGS